MRKKTTAVLFAAAVLLTGCSGGGDHDGARASAAPDSSIAPRSSSLTADLALPVESYVFSEADMGLLTHAMNDLARDCMKAKGFDYRPDETDTPDIGVMDRRYGIANSHTAATYGYHFPTPRTGRANVQALGEAGRIALSGKPRADGRLDPDGGCVGEAKRRLAGDKATFGPDEIARRINMDSYVRSEKDPRVLAVFRAWSSCMASKGYRYGSPMDAIDDPRFGKATTEPAEISTARADVECKKKTGLVRSWFDVESAMQQTEIDKNAETLARIKRHKEDQLKRAAAEVGESR
ncbi:MULTISPECIES: hypothetical protein [unclassified Streptomyces]|uniref:hypothetical protein n=1 Tax=unclassified Streptomyces TaxID=2593676 RepID=UPI002256299C|nr:MULTISPECIES: hypothetical protein [unclassified Streptomyces]MCX4881220.1 hypothetical protein [Streptomyces sp. NBC_00847]MCX5421267.1 hypothetical protein [Streptomyces sp. NBC_00078]